VKPQQLAGTLAIVAAVCVLIALLQPALREAGIVIGLFFAFLAGGVLNWDRRSGH
jgi:hypothetical protein